MKTKKKELCEENEGKESPFNVQTRGKPSIIFQLYFDKSSSGKSSPTVATGQDGPTTGQDGPATGQDGLTTGQDGLTTGQDGLTTGQAWAKS